MIRRLARPLIGAAFINSGVEALRAIDQRASRAAAYGVSDPVSMTRAVAGAQIASGLLLAANRMPRLASFALALSIIPEAATAHDFWASKGEEQQAKRALFARDLGLLGGLMVATVETGGRESVPHRAVRTSRRAARRAVDHVPAVS